VDAKVDDCASLVGRAHGLRGIPGYMAPERLSGDKSSNTFASDMYSLGLFLHQVFSKRPQRPFSPHRAEDVIMHTALMAMIKGGMSTCLGLSVLDGRRGKLEMPSDAAHLIDDLTLFEPKKRPTAAALLKGDRFVGLLRMQ
jgi:serine/threonine protein kinase